MTMITPSGTLMPKAHRHEKYVVSQPPRSGPTAAIPPMVEPQTANAIPRSLPRNVALMSDSDVGRIIAPPTPCSSRAPMRSPAEPERAASTDESAKIVTPSSMTRRRPKRSARVPNTRSSAAKTSV